MEGNLDFCQEYPVEKNVLITSVVKHYKLVKSAIMDKELSDFTTFESAEKFKALIRKSLLPQGNGNSSMSTAFLRATLITFMSTSSKTPTSWKYST